MESRSTPFEGLLPKHRVLINEQALQQRVAELGQEITRDYQGSEPIIVPVLKGSCVFAADLIRSIALPMSVEFLACRSYGDGTESSGVVQITYDLTRSIEGKDVLIVEDIVDTGLTMTYLLENLRTRNPRSIKIVSLLHKPARSRVHVDIHYLGFTIEDLFVVGYGLDFGEKLRNWPYLAVLEG